MAEYRLSIVTPDGKFFDDKVSSLVAPGFEGYFGVLASHAPMLAAIKTGEFKLTDSRGEQKFKVDSGVLEVDSQHNVTLLVDHIESSNPTI